MSAVVAVLDRPERTTARTSLTLAEANALERTGQLERGDGATIHRPTRDAPPRPDVPAPGHFATAGELATVKQACAALALLESRMRENSDAWRDARSAGRRTELPRLEEKGEELKQAHPTLRGPARLAILNTVEAAARRAGSKYREACSLVADAAAELEALATLRDLFVNTPSGFDPLGTWARSALLAPPLGYRPPGWCVTVDPYGRDAYWCGSSATHRDEVRQVQERMRAELDKHTAGAAWPF